VRAIAQVAAAALRDPGHSGTGGEALDHGEVARIIGQCVTRPCATWLWTRRRRVERLARPDSLPSASPGEAGVRGGSCPVCVPNRAPGAARQSWPRH
jgi:hypothetical protein